MPCVIVNALLGANGVIWFLVAEIHFWTGDSPILHAGNGIFAVEFAVTRVARVSMLARPHLLTGPVVASQYCDLSWRIANPIWMVGRAGNLLLLAGERNGICARDETIRSDRVPCGFADRSTPHDRVCFAEKD